MNRQFPVEVSARHVHLCTADVEALFGPGHRLTCKRALSQPGQFLAEERVELVGPKKNIQAVAVLGSERPVSQVEISLTDSRAIGIATPVRESGDIGGTPGIILRGPMGEVALPQGLIAAKRHIHMTPEDAARFGVADKQIVRVAIETQRSLVFGDVVVRVHQGFALAMHIDTDEANAAGVDGGTFGEIVL